MNERDLAELSPEDLMDCLVSLRAEMPDDEDTDDDDTNHNAWLDDAGQATAEYALVLLGAALVALLLVAWATAGGGAGKIGHLLDRVFDAITQKI
jgi:Flp pilus assembly pilin Flp